MKPLRYVDALILWCIGLVFKTERQQKALHQFAKFAVIGVVNTLIDFAIYYILTRVVLIFGGNVYIANTIGFIAGATFSYFANRTWTFSVQNKAGVTEAAKFYGTAASGYAINMLVFYFSISFLGIFDLVAKVIATLVAIFWNFFVTKFFVFGSKKSV